MSQITLDDFIKSPTVLAGVDVDRAYGNQCWDLVELYAEQVLGIPREPWAITLGPEISAKEAWTFFDSHMQRYFIKIPRGGEQKGDIAVYDGHGDYTEGHIAIWLDNGFVFEQNADPDGSLPHMYKRSTTYLLGSLRLKGRNDMYPNKGDIDNIWRAIYNATPNDNDYAYWTTGTSNPSWSKGADQVWKDLMYKVNSYVQDSLRPQTGKQVTRQDVINYLNGNLK